MYILYSQVVKPTLTLPKEFSFATGRPAVKAPTGVAFLFKFMLILMLFAIVLITYYQADAPDFSRMLRSYTKPSEAPQPPPRPTQPQPFARFAW